MDSHGDTTALMRKLDDLDVTKPGLGFEVEAAWFDEQGILKVLIAMPLDLPPPEEKRTPLVGTGGGPDRRLEARYQAA